jgi:aquaporin Z
MKASGGDQPDTMRQRGTAREKLSADFLNPTLEWRRIFAETWGTFLLVVVAAGSRVVAVKNGGAVTLGMMVVAPGLMVMATIYFMGAVRGAHLNPAVTLAFAGRRNFPWKRVPRYVLGQVTGGLAAALFLRIMFGTAGELGATIPGHGIGSGRALAMEILLTAGLVNTILGTASGARNIGANGAIAVSGYIAVTGLWAAPISGAGPGARRPQHDLGLRGRTVCGRVNPCRLRMDTQREAHRCRNDCLAGHARRRKLGYGRDDA